MFQIILNSCEVKFEISEVKCGFVMDSIILYKMYDIIPYISNCGISIDKIIHHITNDIDKFRIFFSYHFLTIFSNLVSLRIIELVEIICSDVELYNCNSALKLLEALLNKNNFNYPTGIAKWTGLVKYIKNYGKLEIFAPLFVIHNTNIYTVVKHIEKKAARKKAARKSHKAYKAIERNHALQTNKLLFKIVEPVF